MKRNYVVGALIALALLAGSFLVRTPAPKVQCPCTANGGECLCTPEGKHNCPCCEPAALPPNFVPAIPIPTPAP